MRVIELKMKGARYGVGKAFRVKCLSGIRPTFSVTFRKGHPPPPSRSLHVSATCAQLALVEDVQRPRWAAGGPMTHVPTRIPTGQADGAKGPYAAEYVRMSTEHQKY